MSSVRSLPNDVSSSAMKLSGSDMSLVVICLSPDIVTAPLCGVIEGLEESSGHESSALLKSFMCPGKEFCRVERLG